MSRFRVAITVILMAGLGRWPCEAETVIRMYACGDGIDYTPSRKMTPSPSDPYPHNRIRMLADQWEALHPGVRIEFIRMPSAQGVFSETYRAWCVSNFIAGTIPHIVYQNMGVFRDADFDKDWLVAMDGYLDRPNPYVEGNERWGDLFYEPWVNAVRSVDGNVYWIGVDTIGVALLVNTDLLTACGVEKPPRTYGQFIDACEKVRARGEIAYLALFEWYSNCVMPAVIWADRIDQMDVLRRDRIVDAEEIGLAVERGLFNCHDDHMREYLRLTKRMYDQYPRGYNIMDELYLFRNGKVAMMEALSVHMRRVADDVNRRFDFEIVPFPEITKEDSRFGGSPLAGQGVAGYSTTWQITSSAVNDGVVDLCVDWLMFLTEPANCESLVNELGFTLPGVRGADPLPMYQELMDRAVAEMERPEFLDWHAFNPFTYTAEFDVNWTRTKECLALDMIDQAEAMNRLSFWLERSHRMFRRRNAELIKGMDRAVNE